MVAPANEPDAGLTEICAQRLRKWFGHRVVLRDINIDIRRGEMVAIVGASGTGKTVLLDLLTGLLKPSAGRVLVADHSQPDAPLVDLGTLDQDGLDRVRLNWSVVFQRNALFTGTVYDNIALWLREHTDMSEEQIGDRVRRSLEAVALDVGDVINKSRDELSGGMAKRVAIARAIAVEPVVIFYDEPTTGLDPVISAHIHELIYRAHHLPVRGGVSPRTSLIVTHDKDLLRRIQPRIIMLHDRGVIFDGSYSGFEESRLAPAVEYLREMPVLQGRETGR
jgi:phospholipid/cholesterol/gamma-HCH transport system ATP-binding protein